VIAFLVGLLVGIPAGLGIGYWLWHVEPKASGESFRPAIMQKDGSVVLARIPVAEPPKAPHIIPKGAKEERRVRLLVMPTPTVTATGETCSCEPVEVNLSLVKGKDGSGVVTSAEGGTIDARESIDMPILDLSPPQYRHFALITAQPGAGNYTGIVGKRFLGNRLGVGIGANKVEGKTPGALVGVEFNW
jgi:hypothetical protein